MGASPPQGPGLQVDRQLGPSDVASIGAFRVRVVHRDRRRFTGKQQAHLRRVGESPALATVGLMNGRTNHAVNQQRSHHCGAHLQSSNFRGCRPAGVCAGEDIGVECRNRFFPRCLYRRPVFSQCRLICRLLPIGSHNSTPDTGPVKSSSTPVPMTSFGTKSHGQH